MSEPWKPELAVDAALARRLIEARFPELTGAALEPFGAGWDNTAFLVGGAWVFRFPRREVAAAALRAECAVLPAVAPWLPLAVPRPRWLGEPGELYPWPFAGYRLIPGRTACVADPPPEARARAAAPLAELLAALHAFPATRARALGLGPDTIRRLDVPYRVEIVRERLGRLFATGRIASAGAWDAILEDAPSDFEPGSSTVVHGDLYARHVLVGDELEPVGVIDWGDVHVGDAACDLALAHSFLPPRALDPFRDRYGAVEDAAWRVARLRALHYGAVLTLYGDEVGDAALAREGRGILRRLRS